MWKFRQFVVKNSDFLPIIFVIGVGVWSVFGRQWHSIFSQAFSGLMGVVGVLAITIFVYSGRASIRVGKNEKVIEMALAQIEKLENKITEMAPLATNPEPTNTGERWPWGDHHTEQLGHLSAAARRFWKLYDPSDIGTAPINKDVAEWLVKERKVSKTMAEAMASILRVDGLRTGPRE